MKSSIKDYTDYAVRKTLEILAVDSPSGYAAKAAEWVAKEFSELGYKPQLTIKDGVTVELGGKGNPLLIMAHIDTLGGMVKEIKSNGRLKIVGIGGLKATTANTENVRIITKFSGVYEGTFQLVNASAHVNSKIDGNPHDFDDTEVVIDENVSCIEDVEKLGISAGDFVCFEPRARVTDSGYIKSRFLDDKLCVGILLAYAKFLKDSGRTPGRKVYLHFTAFEEVGHGGAGFLPQDVVEAISLDMGCVGEGLICTEHMLSICAKDGVSPYSYEVVKGLEAAAIESKADYAVDVYTGYSSDVDVMVRAGGNVRHGCMGPGVYASHGYERSHKDGVTATLQVLEAYIG
ncbi:MAG TPA: M42 family metallopeptidase [Bacillota bacterium]|nr:M42 family metallopeptidase [Bacillota bacterium]HQC35479.1 M42 family metallopeptidase [Bacillota bacterium]